MAGNLQAKLIHSLDLLAYNSDEEYEAIFSQLWLFSKESMSAPARIATWMDSQRMDRWLRTILRNSASASVGAIRRELRREHNVTARAESIVRWFRDNLSHKPIPPPDDDGNGDGCPPPDGQERVSIPALLQAGLVRVGDELKGTRKGLTYTGTVAAGGIQLEDGSVHKSPSGAGKAATGLRAVSGWDFWHYYDAARREWQPLDELRAKLRERLSGSSSTEYTA